VCGRLKGPKAAAIITITVFIKCCSGQKSDNSKKTVDDFAMNKRVIDENK
jgi:hypothetical protein